MGDWCQNQRQLLRETDSNVSIEVGQGAGSISFQYTSSHKRDNVSKVENKWNKHEKGSGYLGTTIYYLSKIDMAKKGGTLGPVS